MPGTYILKPIEANLSHDTALLSTMDPYCAFMVGKKVIKGPVCKKGGNHPHWEEAVKIPLSGDESTICVDLLDQNLLSSDDTIGTFKLDLREVQEKGHLTRWYPIVYKDKAAGEIFVEADYQPEGTSMTSQIGQEINIEEQPSDLPQGSNVFIEQRQTFEPQTFVKDVESVEIKSSLKEIEVMEPHKVKKEVEVTETVPVKKEIPVTEPQVVKKEVEVMEPRVVTKEIKVVEEVPVMKEVEIIEPKTTYQEVETLEPVTYKKEIEVTENVPTKKTVEVSGPITVNKTVEYVEPVITTQTIAKEIQEPVTVGEKVTTSVGPATVTHGEFQTIERSLEEKLRVTETEREYGELAKDPEGRKMDDYSTTTTKVETREQRISPENK